VVSENWTRAIAYLKPNLINDESEATMSLNHADSPILRDLHNGLLVAYMVDEGTRFSYLQNRHLIAAGIDEERLHKTAIGNLYSLAERQLRIQPYGPVFTLSMDGNFEASVLLLDTVWDISFAKHVKEDFVAAVPTRDVLAFGDSSSPEAVAELHAIIARLKLSGADHPLSTALYRRRRGNWLPHPESNPRDPRDVR
jgi:uncharacterized protein YtpQ (UPF0354 family)